MGGQDFRRAAGPKRDGAQPLRVVGAVRTICKTTSNVLPPSILASFRSPAQPSAAVPTWFQSRLTLDPASLDNRDVAVGSEVGEGFNTIARLGPVDFQPVDFCGLPNPQNFPRIV